MNAEIHAVYHGLYIKKYADAAVVAGIMGLEPAKTEQTLKAAVAEGRASEIGGRFTLTPIARVSHLASCSRYFRTARGDAKFMSAYEEFENINIELKSVITSWQTRQIGGSVLPNDHSDSAYDNAIIDKLGRIHDRALKVLGALAQSLPRVQIYSDRLEAAIEKAESGDIAWVSDVKIDSYHTVWFELHEDLLSIVGRERQE